MIHIRLAVPSDELVSFFPTEISKFYIECSKHVYEILNSQKIQNFLRDTLLFEKIETNRISDIRIMIFPCFPDPKDTRGLFNHDLEQISIYPVFSYEGAVNIPSCLMDFKNENLLFILTTQSFHTLIHEILHLKYKDDNEIEKRANMHTANLCEISGYF